MWLLSIVQFIWFAPTMILKFPIICDIGSRSRVAMAPPKFYRNLIFAIENQLYKKPLSLPLALTDILLSNAPQFCLHKLIATSFLITLEQIKFNDYILKYMARFGKTCIVHTSDFSHSKIQKNLVGTVYRSEI